MFYEYEYPKFTLKPGNILLSNRTLKRIHWVRGANTNLKSGLRSFLPFYREKKNKDNFVKNNIFYNEFI